MPALSRSLVARTFIILQTCPEIESRWLSKWPFVLSALVGYSVVACCARKKALEPYRTVVPASCAIRSYAATETPERFC